MLLTKTKYVRFTKCPALAWNYEFDPPAPSTPSAFANAGDRVGELARDYFGLPYVMANVANPPTKPGLYAEYRIRYQDLQCDADLLFIHPDGSIDIYEVKSGSSEDNPAYLEDVYFQYYVARKAGFDVASVNLLLLDGDYVYDGKKHDLKKLFRPVPLTKKAEENMPHVEEIIAKYFAMQKALPPVPPFCAQCKADNGCEFIDRCKAANLLPLTQSVFELTDINYKKKNELLIEGIRTFLDYRNSAHYATAKPFCKTMVETSLSGSPLFLDPTTLRPFLDSVTYPAYFFDFETESLPVPRYAGSHPYHVIPFQYSLHVMNGPNQPLEEVRKQHEEYLGDGETDPRLELVQKMLHDLGDHGSIIVYSEGTESSIIKRLAKEFPAYEKELSALVERIFDLRKAFTCGKDKAPGIYHSSMGPRTTIKYVLPAFFPGDPSLNYKNLGQVQRGDEATAAYQTLATLPQGKREALRKDMFIYCCLDTWAMVVLFAKFLELVGLR